MATATIITGQLCPAASSQTNRMTHRQPLMLGRAQRLSCKSSIASTSSLRQTSAVGMQQTSGRTNLVVIAGNAGTNGPFAPIVRVVRGAMGVKEFNQFRGKAISLHSQVIKEFGKSFGVDNKQVQGLIRLAKKNGEKLGFLA